MALKVVIAGASGKMGRCLIEAVAAEGMVLHAALDAPGSVAIGQRLGQLGIDAGAEAAHVVVTDDVAQALRGADCLIDFTRPEATLAYLAQCVQQKVAVVIGTTGFDAAGKDAIKAAASDISVVFAPNMAIGVNATFKLAEMAAKILGDGYDVEIIEAHHRWKVDAPSGTALKLGEVVAHALGRDLSKVAQHGREGHTGVRDDKSIVFHAMRGGDIVGDHTVVFAGLGERVEVTVRSQSRMTYALGALRAAAFLANHGKGLFDMQDVLGLH